MIRYQFSEAELIAAIEADDKAKKRKEPWLRKAARLTAELEQDRGAEIRSEWPEIKSIYTRRQHGKCAYCERLLGKHDLASVEFDVEHFRPKNGVKPWPPQRVVDELRLPAGFPRSTGKGPGYRLLAYHHLNYASACKTCNSRLKANYFPVAGKHDFSGASPAALHRSEQALLIYPLADFDADPEDLIEFEGYIAKPAKAPGGEDHSRAWVTIAFFRLNGERDDLYLLRAKQLDHVRDKLLLFGQAKAGQKEDIWQDILRLADAGNPHAGCIRSFLRQYGDPKVKPGPPSRQRAIDSLDLAHEYVRKMLHPWSSS
jgi:hypothetical protein